jgi:hypothetical protein
MLCSTIGVINVDIFFNMVGQILTLIITNRHPSMLVKIRFILLPKKNLSTIVHQDGATNYKQKYIFMIFHYNNKVIIFYTWKLNGAKI